MDFNGYWPFPSLDLQFLWGLEPNFIFIIINYSIGSPEEMFRTTILNFTKKKISVFKFLAKSCQTLSPSKTYHFIYVLNNAVVFINLQFLNLNFWVKICLSYAINIQRYLNRFSLNIEAIKITITKIACLGNNSHEKLKPI